MRMYFQNRIRGNIAARELSERQRSAGTPSPWDAPGSPVLGSVFDIRKKDDQASPGYLDANGVLSRLHDVFNDLDNANKHKDFIRFSGVR